MFKIFVYADASFDKKNNVGVAGYLILNNKNSDEIIKTFLVQENNNTSVEFRGVIEALSSITYIEDEDSEINVYTDSRAITDILSRRKRLEATNYTSKRKNKILSGANIYKEFYELCDKYKPIIHWVKGHSPQKNHDLIQKNFSRIDRLVRKRLRDLRGL